MRNFILKIISNVEDETDSFNESEIKEGKDTAILCYIIPLVPYLLNKKNSFIKYHSINGMNLFVTIVFYYLVFKIIKSLNLNIVFIDFVLSIIWLLFLLLCCVGISNVCNGKARSLPLIEKIKVFK